MKIKKKKFIITKNMRKIWYNQGKHDEKIRILKILFKRLKYATSWETICALKIIEQKIKEEKA